MLLFKYVVIRELLLTVVHFMALTLDQFGTDYFIF